MAEHSAQTDKVSEFKVYDISNENDDTLTEARVKSAETKETPKINTECLAEGNTECPTVSSKRAVCENIGILNLSVSRDEITKEFIQVNCTGSATIKYGEYSMICEFESVDRDNYKNSYSISHKPHVLFEIKVEKIIQGHLDNAYGTFIHDKLQIIVLFDINRPSSEKIAHMKDILRNKIFGSETFADFIEYHIMWAAIE